MNYIHIVYHDVENTIMFSGVIRVGHICAAYADAETLAFDVMPFCCPVRNYNLMQKYSQP